MDEDQKKEFEHELELNMAISLSGVGRFRLNMFRQRNEVSVVARNIVTDIPKFEDLGLPEILKKVITAKRGLILFVGGTGSGKSTSLASLIDYRNATSAGHIITIEDPIEYVHKHKKSIINQREVGVDTKSFQAALKNTLRQAPDVILIGEIRDAETMEHALAFAETGHLAISTLHANNANQALDRIINFFPSERHAQILQDMGLNMQAIVSQRLVPTVDNKRVAAVEVLLGTKTIQDLIYKGDIDSIKAIMTKSETLGMQTFDAALFKLYQGGKVSLEEVLKNADSANNLRLRIKLAEGGGPVGSAQEAKPFDLSSHQALAFAGLSLEKTEEEKRTDEKQAIENAELERFQAARKKDSECKFFI
jgi:twitching motility protein PilU